jgi:hypothetical protein
MERVSTMLKASIKEVTRTPGGSTLGNIVEYLRAQGHAPGVEYPDSYDISSLIAADYAKLYNKLQESEIVYTTEQAIESIALYAASQSLLRKGDEHAEGEYTRGFLVHDTMLHMIYGDMPITKMYIDAQCAYSNIGSFITFATGTEAAQRVSVEHSIKYMNAFHKPLAMEAACAYRRFRAMSTGKTVQRMRKDRGIKDIIAALNEEHKYIYNQKRDQVVDIAMDTLARDAVFVVYELMTR